MLSRPTTEQIILDCREELLNTIAPAVPEGPVLVAIHMMENVLRNCATRAAHEIAWMREECAAMLKEFFAALRVVPQGPVAGGAGA